MTTLIAGASETLTLPAGQSLTVIAAALSIGRVWPFVQRLGDTPGVTDIAASGKATLGPLDTDMRYQVECLLGSLTYSVSKDEFGVTVVPKTADHTFAIDKQVEVVR